MGKLTIKLNDEYVLRELDGEECRAYCTKQDAKTCKYCAIHEAVQKLGRYEEQEGESDGR